MNILNILRHSPDFGGGIAQYLKSLGRISQLAGHNLILGFPQKKVWHKELESVSTIIIIPEIENPILSGFPAELRKICDEFKIDIIHFHFYFALSFSLALSFKSWNLPVLQHWHNPPIALIDFLTPSDTLRGKLKRLFSCIVAKITDRRIISRHISISREISNPLIRNKWTKEDKTIFISNGVINISNNNQSAKPISSGGAVIGTVSNFRPQKDHVTLIKAFNILCKKEIKSELWIVGDGPTKLGIESLCKELGIESKVRFLGTVQNPSDFYRQFDIFVLSTHYEGHSLVVLEAMSYGLPVVATRISSIPESVIHGETGLLVNPEDPEDLAKSIQRLIENNQLANKLGNAGRKFIEQQPNIEDWAKRLINLYEQCLREKG